MGMCLDTEHCGFENRKNARFCARCGLPLKGTFLQKRYGIQNLISQDRSIITLGAYDQDSGQSVTVRALIPREATAQERESFLQDAEMARLLSARITDPGSIRVTDYGQDGPLVFLVKAEFSAPETKHPAPAPRAAAYVGGNNPQPAHVLLSDNDDGD
ncbi:MAG: hypothetical protein JO011_05030, partial [Ktedonobacteraceae bacterium]|nr:hypothetical protein [Ktedonobacteraceae bacterium]